MAKKGILRLNILMACVLLTAMSVTGTILALKKPAIGDTPAEIEAPAIGDTTAPTGLIKPATIYLGGELPPASTLVQEVSDDSGRVYISYVTEPDISVAGTCQAKICLKDRFGNVSYITCPITVIDDHTAPIIYGPCDVELRYGDEEYDFMAGIRAEDNYDEEPSIRCDLTGLDIYEPGIYQIRYYASDDAGNCRITTVNVTVSAPQDDDMEAYLKSMVNDIYKEIKCRYPIWTARAILNYVHDNMTYNPASCGTNDIYEAAYYGFTNHTGNCYVYYCMCKLLLDRAGIENMPIVRYPAEPSGHYWILIRYRGYWWHCDATPFKGHEGVYFMLNDNQLDQYHQFDRNAYPARSPSGSNLAIGAVYGYTPSPDPALPADTGNETPEELIADPDTDVMVPDEEITDIPETEDTEETSEETTESTEEDTNEVQETTAEEVQETIPEASAEEGGEAV